ncbi:MAG: cell division protein DivIVA [Arcanobacterium sp.]|nr:cell division protein DivIVA [Arcanobacterium sp.]MDY5589705.1 cell division protein DivIVA [Arcanobacterium sp.]
MKTAFARVGRGSLGYSPQHVNQFLARAQREYSALLTQSAQGNARSARKRVRGSFVPEAARTKCGQEPDAGSRTDVYASETDGSSTRVSEKSRITAASVANVAFPLVRRGYVPAAVDKELARLQAAFIRRQRAAVLAEMGENAWLDSTYERACKLYPRLNRPRLARFADATHSGYSKVAVDKFLNRVNAYFSGRAKLTAKEVRAVAFPSAKKNEAYAEAVVDVYLDELLAVLLAVE